MLEIDVEKTLSGKKGSFSLHAAISSRSRRLVLFGASGSGKTMTLQIIAGLIRPDKGFVRVDGDTLFDSSRHICIPPRLRRIGYVFQDYALFPHLTVQENLLLASLKPCFLSLLPGSLSRIFSRRKGFLEKTEELLERFEIQHLASRYPSQLSGGQRQRVSIARALASSPRLLLLDEPFAALDPLLRIRVRQTIHDILESYSVPLVMITHDPDDVDVFADDLSIYARGSIVTTIHDFKNSMTYSQDIMSFLTDVIEADSFHNPLRPVGWDNV